MEGWTVSRNAEGLRQHSRSRVRPLAPAVPTTLLVHVLCGQRLGSPRLWAKIVAFVRHSLLRCAPQIPFQPEGRARRVSVQTLISGTDDSWLGTGLALREAPQLRTLIVRQAYGQLQSWVLLTDTPVAQRGLP